MSETRRQIRAHVHDNAGVHFNELVRESPFAPGQVQYHLRRLGETGKIVRAEFYGRTHYYPPDHDEWERAALALFRRETSRELVVSLLEVETATPTELTARLEIARSTLAYHVDRLVDHEIVRKRYDDRGQVTVTLAEPERTADLLRAIEPTVPDRLVDRFTRLVDDLLE